MAVTVWSAWAMGLATLVAQAAPPQKCVFEGTARNTATQLGLGQVSIRLVPTNGSIAYAGFSKPDGMFRFEEVVPGDYHVEAHRTGYASQPVLADKAGRAISSLRLLPGQVHTGNDLWFTPDGAIYGKVLGPDGEPLPAAEIILIERKWRHGQRIYGGTGGATADDAGLFHIASVPAGRYWIYVRPNRSRWWFPIVDAPGEPEKCIAGVYFPGATQLDGAQPVAVRAGEEVTGIDFKLPLAPVFHITGVYPAFGENIAVGVKARHGDQTLAWDAETTAAAKDGKFDIAGVPPGSYFLFATQPSDSDRLTSAKLPVTVGTKDVAGLTAPPVGRFDVKGRVRVEGDFAPDRIPVIISYEGSDADDYSSFRRRTEPQSDGSFTIDGLTPDRYHIRIDNLAGGETGYYLKSLRINGVDVEGHVLDLSSGPVENVELILNPAGGSVEGSVLRPPEQPASRTTPEPGESIVVIVPVKLGSGDTQPVDAYLDPAGHYQVSDLEPGIYRVFAVPGYDRGLWQNPDFLRQITARGETVEVAERASVRVDVHALRKEEVRQVEERIE